MATSINKILVPLDNSKNSFRGLSSAIYLAKNCDAKIIALHAVYAPPKGDFDTSGKFNKNHKKQLDSMMDVAENQCKKAGVDFVQNLCMEILVMKLLNLQILQETRLTWL